MTLATKNGAIIVKDGKLAEDCGCCGDWYCYCSNFECGLFDALGLNAQSTATVTISGVETANRLSAGWAESHVRLYKKPGESINTTLCVRQSPRPWWGFDGHGYGTTNDLWMENTGAGFVDRTTPHATVVVTELRAARLAGTNAIGVGIIEPPLSSNTAPRAAFAYKEIDPCVASSQSPLSVTLRASDGDFGTLPPNLFPGANLPENAILRKIYGDFSGDSNLGAFVGEWHWNYSFRNAAVTVTFGSGSCEPSADAKAWWFATPFGFGGEANKPPDIVKLTIDNPTSALAERFTGEYALNLGVYSSFVDAAGNLIRQTQHASSYGSDPVLKGGWANNATVPRYVTAGAIPFVTFVNGVPCVAWDISLNEQPKVLGWYGYDGYCRTTPVPWGENTKGSVTGSGTMAAYIGGGTFRATIELSQ